MKGRVWEEFAVGIVLLAGSIFTWSKGGNIWLCLFFGLIGIAGIFWGIVSLFEK